MRALKMNFGGPGAISIDWNAEVEGLANVAQKSVSHILLARGSDRFTPTRGTDVASSLFGYGAFDFLAMQHTLNFGALKAARDIRNFEGARPDSESIDNISMSLLDVNSNIAEVAVVVTNAAGDRTNQITQVS